MTLHSKRDGLSRHAYLAVLHLRRQGHRVYCAKREDGKETHHEMDGAIVPTRWLLDCSGVGQPRRGGEHATRE